MAAKTSQRPGKSPSPDKQGDGSLGAAARNLAGAAGTKALSSVLHRLEGSAGRLQDYADGGGGAGLKAAISGASELANGKPPGRAALGAGMTALKETAGNLVGGGKGGNGKGKDLKVTNIVEDIDIPAQVRLVYDQWTQFADFPSFMKKVENVEQEADEKLNWKAQVLWSHRNWEATIDRQVPDHMIAWSSKGQKGHVDGTVVFREIGPELTRVLLVLEYHPQGFFEHTGNLWRAQGRRVRLELKHFRRHVMRQVVLHPDELEGWRGEIQDGEVVKDHETAVKEERDQAGGSGERKPRPETGSDDDESDAEDEYDEDEYDEDEDDEDEPEEYEDDGEDEEERGEDSGRRRPAASDGARKSGGARKGDRR